MSSPPHITPQTRTSYRPPRPTPRPTPPPIARPPSPPKPSEAIGSEPPVQSIPRPTPKASRNQNSVGSSALDTLTYLTAPTEFVPGDPTGKMETGYQADRDSLDWAAHGLTQGLSHGIKYLF